VFLLLSMYPWRLHRKCRNVSGKWWIQSNFMYCDNKTFVSSSHKSTEMSFYLSVYGCTALCWALGAFQFLDLLNSLLDSLDGGSARRRAATCTNMTAQARNKRIQTSIPEIGFEPTIPVFERTETVLALDRAAIVKCLYRNSINVWTAEVGEMLTEISQGMRQVASLSPAYLSQMKLSTVGCRRWRRWRRGSLWKGLVSFPLCYLPTIR
jgi:hypothetical protein